MRAALRSVQNVGIFDGRHAKKRMGVASAVWHVHLNNRQKRYLATVRRRYSPSLNITEGRDATIEKDIQQLLANELRAMTLDLFSFKIRDDNIRPEAIQLRKE
jgi:hypothetical protein